MTVSDRTAIVTGAGSKRGIGRATSHALAAAGWNVAILDLDEPSAKEAADEVAERQQVQTAGVGCDVSDEASVEAALGALDGSMPPVGALVNNAGITSPTRFLDVTGEEWDRIFAVNVRGSYNITRRVVPGMVERGFGRIVFLSSVSAERGGGVFGGKSCRTRFRPGAGAGVGAKRYNGQLRRARFHRNRHQRRGSYGRAQGTARRTDSSRPRRQRQRCRRPHHFPMPRGVELHHRSHVRRQRRLPHPLTPGKERRGRTATECARDPRGGAPRVVGVPYVVFADNLGGDDTLAHVIDVLRGTDGNQSPHLRP